MIDSLTPPVGLLCAGILVLAYIVRGIAGFGSGLIAIPLLALFLPLTLVVPLVVFLDYVASATHGVKDRRHIHWREILPLLPFTAIGVLTGLYLFKTVDSVLLANALGIFVMLYALYTLFVHESDVRATAYWVIPAGGLGGLIGTLFGTGGPFYVAYLKHRGLKKKPFRATFATLFLLDGAGRLIGYASSGFFARDWLLTSALALPIMALGLYIGGHIHTTISQRHFQIAVSILLLFSGVSLILRH